MAEPRAPAPKRKRGEAPEPEQENIKPPSRTRRSTSAAPSVASTSKARANTRLRPSLPEVPESDEDAVEEIAPPTKKSRPSFEPEEEEDEVVEIKPRAKRASSRKPSSAAPNGGPPVAISNGSAGSSAGPRRPARSSVRSTRTSTRTVKKEVSDDDDEVQEVPVEDRKPPGRKRRTSVPETIVISEDEEDEEDVKPDRGHRAAPSRLPAKKTTAPREEIVLSDDEEEDIKPTRSRKGSAKPQPPKGNTTTRKAIAVSDDDEEEQMEKSREDEEVGREGPIAAPRTAGEDKAEVVESSDAEETDTVLELPDQASEKPDEEEKSLLDPPKTQKIQPQTISSVPEERQGPKSRLVIHKMALVNFKSYAGRQEIGPFHKVRFLARTILCLCSYRTT